MYSRRDFLKLMGAAAMAAGGKALLPANESKVTGPNVIVVFIDDMGWGDLSCFGGSDVTTENIDRLANEGIRFEQFYVNSPICSPSRVAISTGQYPQRWRIGSYLSDRSENDRRGIAHWLDPAAPMLARFLQQGGYATGHFGKWHMGGQRNVGEAPLISEYGFDESLTNFEGLGPRVLPLCDAYDGKGSRKHALGSDNLGRGPIMWEDRSKVTESFVTAAIKFIGKAQAEKKPFYVNVWPDDVHSPFFPAESARGDGKKRTLYYSVLDAMDRQLGVLFDTIREDKDLRNNTIIVFCSDNGPEKGAGVAGPLRGYKTMLYEGGIRSPLIVWGPGLIDSKHVGTVNKKSFVAAIDLVPSLLAIAGVKAPENVQFDGQPMADVLLGRSERSRTEPLFFRRPPDRDSDSGLSDLPDLAVREGQWKLLCEYDGSNAELYNLTTDTAEQHNVASEHPGIVKRLTDAVIQWHRLMPPDLGATYGKNAR
jgi:uncharacterized sulfatase